MACAGKQVLLLVVVVLLTITGSSLSLRFGQRPSSIDHASIICVGGKAPVTETAYTNAAFEASVDIYIYTYLFLNGLLDK